MTAPALAPQPPATDASEVVHGWLRDDRGPEPGEAAPCGHVFAYDGGPALPGDVWCVICTDLMGRAA